MEAKKTTLILGASPTPTRYAYMAAHQLVKNGYNIINVGNKNGEVAGICIQAASQIHQNIDTITLYIGPKKQPPLYQYILKSKPLRLIFNPGTENLELKKIAEENGIITLEACTLVLLATKQY